MRQAFAPRQKCATGAHIRRVRWYIIAGMMRMTRIRLFVVLGLCCAARCGVCLAEGADGVEYGVIERQMAEFAEILQFEQAAAIRDKIAEIRRMDQ